MSGRWQTVRVFISSTFRDMHAERDHLVKVVFPALRERLEKHRVYLIDIDLRWGVTREQAENDQVLDLCLQQIDECRPFFIGILGQRYGWVPTRYPTDALKKFGWIQQHTGKSVTELEILHGVLQNRQMRGRAFFYFRDPVPLGSVPEAIRRDVYADTDPELIRKLDDLKQQIRHSGYPVMENYPARWDPQAYDRPSRSHGRLVGLEALGERVRDQLWQAIQEELQLPEQPSVVTTTDPLAEEQDYHERFMESRLRVYVGREQLNDTLFAFADGHDLVPCLLTGPSGSGKSAALAHFVESYQRERPNAVVVSHFIGASPRSTNLRQLLHRICSVLKVRFGFAKEIEDDTNSLIATFRRFVDQVPDSHRVVLVLDALNQLDESDNARNLHWFPWELPSHVKLIASCIADPDHDEAVLGASEYRTCRRIEVGPLTDAERRAIVRKVPSLSAKTLDEAQINLLLANPATTNPLFLLVALEELRAFGSFAQLNRRIEIFPRAGDTVTGIFLQVIERLEADFDSALVRELFSLLASARRGMAERELLELLERPGIEISESTSDLFPVLRQLRPYLQNRGQLRDFFHSNLLKAVRARYLDAHDKQCAVHARLAHYFRTRRDTFQSEHAIDRAIDELPWQYTEAENWPDLIEVLLDMDLFAMAMDDGREYEWMRYWNLANQGFQDLFPGNRLDIPDLYQQAWSQPHFNPLSKGDALGRLGSFFQKMGLYDAAERCLAQEAETSSKAEAAPRDATANLLDRALVKLGQGEAHAAVPTLEEAARQIERQNLAGSPRVLSRKRASLRMALGRAKAQLGNIADARTLLTAAVEDMRNGTSDSAPELATAIQTLANFEFANSDPERALHLHEEAYRIRRDSLGRDHFDVALSLHNIGNVHGVAGRICESMLLTQRALEIFEAQAGPDHPFAEQSRKELGKLRSILQTAQAKRSGFGTVILLFQQRLSAGTSPDLSTDGGIKAISRTVLDRIFHLWNDAIDAREAMPVLLLALPEFAPVVRYVLNHRFALPISGGLLESGLLPRLPADPTDKESVRALAELTRLPDQIGSWLKAHSIRSLAVVPWANAGTRAERKVLQHVLNSERPLLLETIGPDALARPLFGLSAQHGQLRPALLPSNQSKAQGYVPQSGDELATGAFFINCARAPKFDKGSRSPVTDWAAQASLSCSRAELAVQEDVFEAALASLVSVLHSGCLHCPPEHGCRKVSPVSILDEL
jgi:tetratricopeptide (TPR) repeat protein